MRGLTFPGDRKVDFVEIPDPTPAAGEVVLEMKVSGICGSDLHVYRAPAGTPSFVPALIDGPIIAGHEPCGIVAAVGKDVSPTVAKVGDRVMVHHYWGCTCCRHCRTGWPQMCTTQVPAIYGANTHGAHAQYMKVPAGTLVHLPDELSFASGAAISCGTGTAYQALKRLNLSGDETVAIYGQGPVGLAGTQLAAAMGVRVIALDLDANRLVNAQKFGADVVINPGETDAPDAIREATGGLGADAAFEASGSPIARSSAIKSVRPWASVAMVGVGGDVTIDVAKELIQPQVTVFGTWSFSSIVQEDCARFAAAKGVALDAIFENRWTLDQAEEAYRVTDAQSSGKGLFDIG